MRHESAEQDPDTTSPGHDSLLIGTMVSLRVAPDCVSAASDCQNCVHGIWLVCRIREASLLLQSPMQQDLTPTQLSMEDIHMDGNGSWCRPNKRPSAQWTSARLNPKTLAVSVRALPQETWAVIWAVSAEPSCRRPAC